MKRKIIISLVGVLGLICLLIILLSGTSTARSIAPPVPKMTEVEIEIIKDKPRPCKEKNKLPVLKKKVVLSNIRKVKKNKLSDNGSCPPLNANYRKYVGFAVYSKAMQSLGANFYIVGNGTKKLLKINFYTNSLTPVTGEDFKSAGYSPRSRVISDEPALNGFLKQAKQNYHIINPEVVLLIPQSLEHKLALSLLKTLKREGLTFNDVSGFKGQYLMSGNHLVLKVSEAVKKCSGKIIPLKTLIAF